MAALYGQRMPKSTITTAVRITPELHQRLVRGAKWVDRSQQWIITHAISDYLTVIEKESERASLD